MDKFAAAVQRLAATNSIEKDREFYNLVRTQMGLTPYPDTDPVHEEFLNEKGITSRSGDSFSTASGGLNGTSDDVSERDNSIANKANG